METLRPWSALRTGTPAATSAFSKLKLQPGEGRVLRRSKFEPLSRRTKIEADAVVLPQAVDIRDAGGAHAVLVDVIRRQLVAHVRVLQRRREES